MGNKRMRSWNGWEPWLRAWLRWWPLTSHASTGGSGTMGHNAQGKVGVVGNASETGINPSLAAPCGCCCREWRNNGQGGMEPSAPGEALEHHHLWVGKRRRGAEMQLGREILPSCRPWQQPPSQLQPRMDYSSLAHGFLLFSRCKSKPGFETPLKMQIVGQTAVTPAHDTEQDFNESLAFILIWGAGKYCEESRQKEVVKLEPGFSTY